jgi:ATP-dependent RNA helicase RhlE
MLDMGFLPDIKRVLSHLPKDRQTLFFSPPCRADRELSRVMLRQAVTINQERVAKPAVGITQALYPFARSSRRTCSSTC